MSDDEDGTVSEEGIKSLGDLFFREGVESTRWFIEEDDLWIFEKDLGNSKTLFLSSTESDSSFSDFSVESMFEIKDEITVCKTEGFSELLFYFLCFCHFERSGAKREILLCFLIGKDFSTTTIVFARNDRHTRNSTHEILSDGTIKDTGFLGEIPDVGIIGFECGFIETVSEDGYMSLIRVKVSCDEFHESSFASSTLSDKRCFLSLLDGEREVLKYIVLIVAVGDVFDDDGFLFGSEGGSGVVACDRRE